MATALLEVRRALGLKVCSARLAELLAAQVIELARTGMRDPIQIRDRVLSKMGETSNS